MKLLRRYEDQLQLLTGLLGGALMAWWLHSRGWPWYSWLPAALLAVLAVGLVWVTTWYLRRRLTYLTHAARNKADLAAGGDGWPNHRQD